MTDKSSSSRATSCRDALEFLVHAAEDFVSSDPDMPSHMESERVYELAVEKARKALASPSETVACPECGNAPGVPCGLKFLAKHCPRLAPPSATRLSDLPEANELVAMAGDARRFAFLLADPETGRHLLSLLQQKKGNEDSLRKMIDRIITASKENARE